VSSRRTRSTGPTARWIWHWDPRFLAFGADPRNSPVDRPTRAAAGTVVAVAMAVLVFGTAVGEWLQVRDRCRGASTVRWCSAQPAGDRLSADSAARRPRGVRPDLSGLAGTGSLVDLAGRGLVPAGADAGRADDDRASSNGLRPHSPERRPGRPSTGSEEDKAVRDFRRCWRADRIRRGQFRCTGPDSGWPLGRNGDFSGRSTTSTTLADVILRRFRRDNHADIEEATTLNRSVVDVDHTTEPSQTVVMMAKVASAVMPMSGSGRSMNFWHVDALRLARPKTAAGHPSPLCQAGSEPLGWTATQRVSPTSHVVESAIRLRARGCLTRAAGPTHDANGVGARSDHSAKRSKARRWP
jgi:hypothetical protein